MFNSIGHNGHIEHTGTQDAETERLRLRRFVLGDANKMFIEWASDENVTKYLTWKRHTSVAETKTFLMNRVNDYLDISKYLWAIELKETGELIGSIGFDILSETNRCADFGYCIGTRFWNKGYVTEALRALTDYMLYDVNINRVEAYHSVNNPASGKVMQKAGLILEGRCRQKYITGEGIYQDADLYGLVKEDFEKPYIPEKPDFLDLSQINLTRYNVALVCAGYQQGNNLSNKSKRRVPMYCFNITEIKYSLYNMIIYKFFYVFINWICISEYQYILFYAVFSQLHSLVKRRNSEKINAAFGKLPRNKRRPMTVSVSFYNSHNF